jgi:adenine C2-methylase RlmN of 23S rRNA A2503 and tRNA A37
MAAIQGAFRSRLAALGDAQGDVVLSDVATAADGTRKLVFRLADAGGGSVEAVIIPAASGGRTTLCVSSQLGAQACPNCLRATALRADTPRRASLPLRHQAARRTASSA